METYCGTVRSIDCHAQTITVEYREGKPCGWVSGYTFPIWAPGMHVIGPLLIGSHVNVIFDEDDVTIKPR